MTPDTKTEVDSAARPGSGARDDDARGNLVRQMLGLFPAQVLHTLVALGVPEHLTARPRPLADLATATDTHLPSLRRLLRAAVGLGLARLDPDDRVALTDAGRLLRADTAGSVRNLVLLWGGDGGWRSWGQLAYSVRTGQPAYDHLLGRSLFQHLADHPAERAVFDQALAESTKAASADIVRACALEGWLTVVDVGGGSGTLLAAVLAANPDASGVLFDRPSCVAEAHQVLEKAGVGERCAVRGGDFFDSVPSGGDAYLLKSVLHDWDDDRCLAILRNCRAAMREGAALYLVEPVVPAGDVALAAAVMTLASDLNMLVCTGGVERTEAEFRALLAQARLPVRDVVRCPRPSNLSVLHAVAA